jgi:hypothetical protein
MSIWKWVGAAAGGVGGFVVGGPVGAAAGASAGYSIGASADNANKADDQRDAQLKAAAAQGDKNAQAALAVRADSSAFNQFGNYGDPADQYVSDDSHRLSDQAVQLSDAVAAKQAQIDSIQKAMSTPEGRAAASQYGYGADLQTLQGELATLQRQSADTQSQFRSSREADKRQNDQVQFSRRADAAGNTQAYQIDPTKIDWSNAKPYEDQQNATRQMQLDQAGNLMGGASGAGQQSLVDRLNGDLNGNQPSLAQLQLEAGRDASINNSLSIANSARGNTQGIAQLEAIRANQATMQDTGRSAAMLRAQEYAQARGELGGVLSQQRGQGIQEQNIAATQLGQARGQDLSALGYQYNNSVQQGQLDQQRNVAQASVEGQQRALNAQREQYFTDKYTGSANRQTDLNIDRTKTQAGLAQSLYGTQVNQGNLAMDRQVAADNASMQRDQQRDAAITGMVATTGQQLVTSGALGGGVKQTPGATTPAANGYTDSTVVDPWKKEGT